MIFYLKYENMKDLIDLIEATDIKITFIANFTTSF